MYDSGTGAEKGDWYDRSSWVMTHKQKVYPEREPQLQDCVTAGGEINYSDKKISLLDVLRVKYMYPKHTASKRASEDDDMARRAVSSGSQSRISRTSG